MSISNIPVNNNPGEEEVAKIRFYYATDDLFNNITLRTHYRASSILDANGVPQLDENAISKDELDYFTNRLTEAIKITASIVSKLSKHVKYPIIVDETLNGTLLKKSFGIEAIDNKLYNPRLLYDIDLNIENMLLYYVLKEWYTLKHIQEEATINYNIYKQNYTEFANNTFPLRKTSGIQYVVVTPKYNLTINLGIGDGAYVAGTIVQIVADAPASGYQFKEWTGDIDFLNHPENSTAYVTITSRDITITATYQLIPYQLIVNKGNGDGYYPATTQVQIVADAPEEGYEFKVWTGNIAYLNDPELAIAIITMPNHIVWLEAVYVLIPYTLIVNSGTGDGTYTFNQVVQIVADAPQSGYQFKEWTGDTQYLASATSSTTNVTMPSANVSVTATYELIPIEITTDKQTDFNIQIICSIYNTITIDFGDGTTTLVESEATNSKTHTWATGGSHVVKIFGDGSKITGMNVSGQSVTELIIRSSVINLNNLFAASNQLQEIILPDGITSMENIWIENNQITNLQLPPNIESLSWLDITNNQLSNIQLPNTLISIIHLSLGGNFIQSITIPPLLSLTSINLNANMLNTTAINSLLDQLIALNITGGTLYARNQTGGGCGDTAKINILDNTWLTVEVDACI